MQGLEDALKCQNDDDADIFKVLQCFFFSNLRSKLMTDDVIKNVCDVITLIKQFLVWNQNSNSHSQFESSIQKTSFFQNLKWGNDVTNFKVNYFKPELEKQLLCKTWRFYNI